MIVPKSDNAIEDAVKNTQGDPIGPPPATAPRPKADDLLGPLTADEMLGPDPDTRSIPKALLDRLAGAAEGGMKVLGAAADAAKEGFGGGDLGLAPESAEWLRKIGLFPDPATGRTGILRTFNESLIRPLAAAGDGVIRAINAGVYGIGGAVGGAVTEVTGDESEGARAKREMVNLQNFIMLEAGMRVTRAERAPNGGTRDVVVGGLPVEGEFAAAARAIGDDLAEPIVRKAYNEKGILPAEILADARTDVTITQDLLLGKVPEAYGGGGGAGSPPKPPAKFLPAAEAAPEPPPVGSLGEAQEKILSRVNTTGDKRPMMTWDQVYTRWFDDLNPVKTAQETARKEAGMEPLATGDSPYDLLRLTRGVAGKADVMLEHQGPFDFNSYAKVGRSLKEIIAPVQNDMDGLRAYVTSKRALELEARGVKTGFDAEAAKQVLSGPKKEQFEQVHRALVNYQNQLTAYLRDSGVLSQSAYKAMTEANKDYVPFYRYLNPELGLARVSPGPGRGLAPKNPLKAIKGSDEAINDPIESIIKNTYTYIALAEKNAAGVKLVDLLKQADRGMTVERDLLPGVLPAKPKAGKAPDPLATEGPTPGALETSFKGADLEITPPKQSLLERVKEDKKSYIDVDAVEILEARKIVNEDLAAVITTAAREPTGDAITVFRNGMRETYKVNDPELLAAWRGLDKENVSLITQILAVPARTLRAGAVLDPAFMAKGIIRDFFSAVINTKGAVFSPIDYGKGLVGVARKDQDFVDFLKGGGANSAMVSLDRNYLSEDLFRLHAQTGLMDRAWNVVNSPLRGLRMTSELLDNATRLAEFKKLKGAGSKAEIQSAALSARDVTLDFQRIGAQIRSYNMITAFANAAIQEPDRLARAFKASPGGTSAKIVGGIMTPSALLWWANHEDPRWKEIPNWQKDMFWLVMTKDTVYRIPKPFGVGIVFGSGTERTMEAYFSENPKAYKEFSKSVMASLGPSVVPTAGVPLLEQFANRNMFGGDKLIPSSLEKMVPEYQYNAYTSDTAKELAKVFGAFPGIRDAAGDENSGFNGMARAISSPALLENYISGYTGGLGRYALQISSAALEATGVTNPPPKPLGTLADVPFVRAFVVRYPSSSAQSIQEFYDRNEQSMKVMNSIAAKAKSGDFEAAQWVIDNYKPRVTLPAVQKALGEQGQLIRNINANREMKPEEKRQLIDSIYFTMIEVTKQANKMLDEVEKSAPK